jgi:hypothetical protein
MALQFEDSAHREFIGGNMWAKPRKNPKFPRSRVRPALTNNLADQRRGILTYARQGKDSVWIRLVKAIGTQAPGFAAKLLVELIYKVFLAK